MFASLDEDAPNEKAAGLSSFFDCVSALAEAPNENEGASVFALLDAPNENTGSLLSDAAWDDPKMDDVDFASVLAPPNVKGEASLLGAADENSEGGAESAAGLALPNENAAGAAADAVDVIGLKEKSGAFCVPSLAVDVLEGAKEKGDSFFCCEPDNSAIRS